MLHAFWDDIHLAFVQCDCAVTEMDFKLTLNEGEIYVVPKGVEHKPVAKGECHILLIEPTGTVNTGEVVSEKTAPHDVWI